MDYNYILGDQNLPLKENLSDYDFMLENSTDYTNLTESDFITFSNYSNATTDDFVYPIETIEETTSTISSFNKTLQTLDEFEWQEGVLVQY